MSTSRTSASVCAAVAAATLLAGCGSGSGSGGSSGASGQNGPAITAKAEPSLAKQVPPAVAKTKTLTVGVALGSPPDEFQDDDNKIVGWEVDIVRATAQALDLELSMKPAGFDSLIPSLEAKRYDAAIGQFGVTGEREKVVDFVTTLQSNELFAARKESHLKIDGLEDLCGRSVATTRGSREYEFAKAQNPKCVASGKKTIDIKVFNDSNQAGLSLTSKRTDLFWLGATAVSYFVKQTNGQTEIVGSYLKPNPLGIALPKDSGMAKPVQAAVQHLIDDGTYGKIMKKWGLEDGAIDQSEINPAVAAG